VKVFWGVGGGGVHLVASLALVRVGRRLWDVRVRVIAKCTRDDCRMLYRGHSIVDLGPAFDQHVAQLRKTSSSSNGEGRHYPRVQVAVVFSLHVVYD
jgi:hypothetical protein